MFNDKKWLFSNIIYFYNNRGNRLVFCLEILVVVDYLVSASRTTISVDDEIQGSILGSGSVFEFFQF